MNICTIVGFRAAADDPRLRLRQLSDARPADGSAVCRSTLFAECRMRWRGEEWLLYAPISLRSMERAERAAMVLRALTSDRLSCYRILRDEILVDTVADLRCDAVIEPLGEGRPLSQVVGGMESESLARSVGELRRRLQRLDISHNNLSPDNIAVDASGALHPIRWHYATQGFGGDSEAFACLESYVAQHALCTDGCLHDTTAAYGTRRLDGAEGYLGVGNMFEDRMRVQAAGGWGFVDSEGRMIVAPRYFWVDDFREGRAAVQSFDSRMGLIDKSGREIIAVRYDIVEYDVNTGCSWVCLDSLWAQFDYSGCRTTEWLPRSECDIEL